MIYFIKAFYFKLVETNLVTCRKHKTLKFSFLATEEPDHDPVDGSGWKDGFEDDDDEG